ncbi:MAG: hypothetical protein D8M58_05935 [Calditrichaeota bacterium]|nr:MAG: hypothetical protein DWQ03_20570 [Calditrichota bacterium]MBL1204918.1 hypothetical protein [Calditrichota bacterium]NOG44747.1 hypothetical protein [Calditrichota bacterium]
MSFCTAITCMDGRIQQPVFVYLQNYFNVDYVDTITEPGPNKVLAERNNLATVRSIIKRSDISLNVHQSKGIAVVGHHDCAGNPVAKEKQVEQIKDSISFLQQTYSKIDIIGLWVDNNWDVTLIK